MMLLIFYFFHLWFKVLVKGYRECVGYDGLFNEMVGVGFFNSLFYY